MSETLDYSGLSADEAAALLDLLEAEEADVSAQRARLHDRIDFARPTAGNDVIASQRLDKLIADERELADRRREIHARITKLKAARRMAG